MIFTIEFPLLTTEQDESKLETIFNLLQRSCNYFINKYQKRFYEMYKRNDYKEIVEKLYATERKKELNELIKNKNTSDEDREKYKNELSDLKNKTLSKIEKDQLYEQLHKIQDMYRLRGTYPDYVKGDLSSQSWIKKQNKYMQKDHEYIHGSWLRACIDGIWKGIRKKVLNPKIRLHYKDNTNFLSSFSGKHCGGKMGDGIIFDKVTHEVTIGMNKKPLKVKAEVKNKEYEIGCLSDSNQIRYGKIVRRKIRNHFKYYIQLTINGIIPEKKSVKIGDGTVGIDIGTQTIAVVSDYSVIFDELCRDIDKQEHKISKLQRALDRSRRANNPHFYNDKGEIIKITKYNEQEFLDKNWIKLSKHGKSIRLWKDSKNYKQLKEQISELKRRQAVFRKTKHIELANLVLREGNQFYVEDMSFRALSMRAKETTVNEKTGKFNKKKRFGKSIANKAPALFLTILENKVKARGGVFEKVDKFGYRASQYNHFTGEYCTKTLGERVNHFANGDKIQRDLYSAFLIQNPNEDLKSPNKERISRRYPKFKQLHDQDIKQKQLDPHKYPRSMGINDFGENYFGENYFV